jgi:hypothetical protein
MQFAMSDSSQKGGVSVLLFHCLFNSNGSVTHFMHDLDVELYRSLPNLYAVCISDTSSKQKITAGFFIKTSYSHHDSDFLGALTNVISMESGMRNLIHERSSCFPARIGISGDAPPSEDEMLRLIVGQALKHGVGGSA